MFCADDIVSEGSRRQSHVYNLLVALKNLSADERRRQDAISSTDLASQPIGDNGQLTHIISSSSSLPRFASAGETKSFHFLD